MQAIYRRLTMVVLVGAALMVLPTIAEAGHKSDKIAYRVARVEAQINELRYVPDPYARLEQVERLGRRLDKLSYHSREQRGRHARVNDYWIEVLQGRLYRIEKRASYHAKSYRPYPHRHEGYREHGEHEHDHYGREERHGRGYVPGYGIIITGSIGFP